MNLMIPTIRIPTEKGEKSYTSRCMVTLNKMPFSSHYYICKD